MRRYQLLAGAATLALGLIAAQTTASAAVIQVAGPQQLSATPISFTLGTGTFSFTLDTTSFAPAADIATSGSGMVTTLFGVTDFEAGSTINNDQANLLYTFAPYPTASLIPNSQADDFVGFSYAGTGGTHYGYAEVFGSTFVGYAYETAANTAITASPVPEPASVALLISGLTMVGVARRKRRSNGRSLAV